MNRREFLAASAAAACRPRCPPARRRPRLSHPRRAAKAPPEKLLFVTCTYATPASTNRLPGRVDADPASPTCRQGGPTAGPAERRRRAAPLRLNIFVLSRPARDRRTFCAGLKSARPVIDAHEPQGPFGSPGHRAGRNRRKPTVGPHTVHCLPDAR